MMSMFMKNIFHQNGKNSLSILVAEYLLRHEPQSISPMFDLASVFETRVNNLQNQNGSPLVTRPDEALSSLKELQNGIGNVLEALK